MHKDRKRLLYFGVAASSGREMPTGNGLMLPESRRRDIVPATAGLQGGMRRIWCRNRSARGRCHSHVTQACTKNPAATAGRSPVTYIPPDTAVLGWNMGRPTTKVKGIPLNSRGWKRRRTSNAKAPSVACAVDPAGCPFTTRNGRLAVRREEGHHLLSSVYSLIACRVIGPCVYETCVSL